VSDRWERRGELDRLVNDMHDLVMSLRLGAVEPSSEELAAVLVAGAQVAGEAARLFEKVD
jgi:hypothetical protein